MELNAQGISQRSIETSVHSSHQTVKAALDRAQELHITWPLDNDVTNEMLDELFYGSRCSGNKYGITRGASYWKKGGGGHAE